MTAPRSRAGRKAAPTAMLKLRGSANVTRLARERSHEPKPVGDLDEPPPDLTPPQEAIWRYYIEHMPRGVMKKVDHDTLRAWVEACDRHNQARLMQAALDRDSKLKLLIKTKDGFVASPYCDIMDKTARTMIRLAQELGFSPAARPRIHADGPTIDAVVEDERPDPWRLLEVIEGGKKA